MVAGLENSPYGKNEVRRGGRIDRQRGGSTSLGPKTGLPIPAHAEIAFEGFIYLTTKSTKPVGRETGYYGRRPQQEPVIPHRKIECTVTIRSSPVRIPPSPPDETIPFMRGFVSLRRGVESKLEAAGVPGVMGVWSHAPAGQRLWLNGIDQAAIRWPRKQAGLIASQCHAGGLRPIDSSVVVDERH